jgi:hypothetical protein
LYLKVMRRQECLDDSKTESILSVRRLYALLAPRAYSVLMFGALFCTLTVKFFHSWRYSLIEEYLGWILADISVILGIEVILAIVCFQWPRRWIIRTATVIAAVICTWSVMNAGWLIRTGTQILPTELLPLIRDPLNSLGIIAVNLIRMPKAAIALLAPSFIGLTFFFFALAKPAQPTYNRRLFIGRIVACIVIVGISVSAWGAVVKRGSPQIVSAGLRYNSQLRAVMSLVLPDLRDMAVADIAKATRKIPYFDQIKMTLKPDRINHNLVLLVIEGVQYNYTSLADKQNRLTPYLHTLARQGVEFKNTRSTVTHTTKALFSLLTGRFPSASQDIAEAVPVEKSYASLATILSGQLGFRTAFFQSAKGNFESRPSLVYNLGFDKFWARDDLNDSNSFVGYLGCDEFSMLEPIIEWITSDDASFFLTILCSVTHDPYVVPEWFAEPARDPVERYRQAISYTDKFLSALDVELAKLNLVDKTIFCVIGDHGEAFGEHGLLGHERIAFDEVLRIPFCLRAPFLVEPGTLKTELVSSVDLTPTLLGLFGFETESGDFDGTNVLKLLPLDRKIYFAGWMQQGPAGFVQGHRKFTYSPENKSVSLYNLKIDPLELNRVEVPEPLTEMIAAEISKWRKETIFRIDQQRTGEKTLFGSWQCNWTERICSAKYQKRD